MLEEMKKLCLAAVGAAAIDMKPLTKDSVQDVLENLNLATKSDIESLKIRINELEEKINNK